MKIKKFLIPILLIAALLAVCIIAVGIIAARGNTFAVGHYLRADNGADMVITDRGSHIRLTDINNKHLFAKLSSGDRIAVVIGAIAESYPAQAGAYGCFCISKGEISDIPDDALASLSAHGWINIEKAPDISGETAEYSYGYAGMSLTIPDGWKYEIVEHKEDTHAFGIDFYPSSYSEGKLSLFYYPSMFGVCGTGLSQNKISLGGYDASMGIYDNNDVWTFISFKGTAGDYAVWNYGADQWWDEYGKEAMAILDTVKFSDSAITAEEATERAKAHCTKNYSWTSAIFDFESGIWKISFYPYGASESTDTVYIDHNGNTVIK